MAQRWNAAQIAGLAPDVAALSAAAGLAVPRPWSGTGATDELVWGLCSGSGKTPYQTCVDLTGPAYRCSCPSRKFPCKHALALLLLWGGGTVPDAAEPAEFAAAWQQGRTDRVAKAPSGERDEAAAAVRAAQRADRVRAGLDELTTWLRDQIRAGVSGAPGRYSFTEPVAARMVDAQAPGVASTLRALGTVPASGDGWPERLLGGYARLHLLARAHSRLAELPPAFAATVRTHVGYQVRRDDVLAGSDPVVDDWDVLAVRDLADAPIPTRRSYLRARSSGRYALVLAFAPGGDFGANADASFLPGTSVRTTAHFYPARPPLRVVIGDREPATASPRPVAMQTVGEALDEWAAVLELDPWLTDWPVVVRGIPVPGDRWRFADSSGASVPLLLGATDPWVLAAVGGGSPVTVAGEWGATGFRPLTCWHGDDAVPL